MLDTLVTPTPSVPETDIQVKIASSVVELTSAFQLAYTAYRRAGLTPPNPFEMRVTPYQVLPTTEVFIATALDEVVCTISLVRDGRLGLPMEDIYPTEIARRRALGVRLAEVSCLADRRDDPARGLPTVVKLMGLMAQCALRRGVEELVIAVHPRHVPFYRRFAGFEPIGELKTYQAVCGHPAVALAMNFERATLLHPRAHQRFLGKPFPEEQLAYRPISEPLRARLAEIADCGRVERGSCQLAVVSEGGSLLGV